MTDETVKDLYYLNMQTYKKMPPKYNNWIYWDEYHNKDTGFSGWCYKKDGKVVMIVKGTDIWENKDRQNDWALANNRVPEQLKDARKFRQKIVKENPSSELIQTGYSLGGSIVMSLGSATGDRTYTYSAFGVKDFAGKDAKYSENITNYGYHKDPIFNANRDNMIGKVFMTGTKNEKIQVESTNLKNLPKHSPDFQYDIDNIQEYTPKEHLTVREKLMNGNYSLANHLSKRQKASVTAGLIEESAPKSLKGGITMVREIGVKTLDTHDSFRQKAMLALRPAERMKHKLQDEWDKAADAKNKFTEKFKSQKKLSGYVNYFTKSERIFTKEEIENMPYKKQKELKDAINYQKEKIGIPTKDMAKKAVESGGMVLVKEYVRAGGVHVQSYYRARPSN